MSKEQEVSIVWPQGIESKDEKRLRKAASKPDLPETILSIMEEGFYASTRPLASYPFDSSIRAEVYGYGLIIGEMKATFRLSRNKAERIREVKGTFEMQDILRSSWGIPKVVNLNIGMDLLEDHRQQLEIIGEDPSGLSLASHLVGELFGKNESRWRGAMAAADRYWTLMDIALGT